MKWTDCRWKQRETEKGVGGHHGGMRVKPSRMGLWRRGSLQSPKGWEVGGALLIDRSPSETTATWERRTDRRARTWGRWWWRRRWSMKDGGGCPGFRADRGQWGGQSRWTAAGEWMKERQKLNNVLFVMTDDKKTTQMRFHVLMNLCSWTQQPATCACFHGLFTCCCPGLGSEWEEGEEEEASSLTDWENKAETNTHNCSGAQTKHTTQTQKLSREFAARMENRKCDEEQKKKTKLEMSEDRKTQSKEF